MLTGESFKYVTSVTNDLLECTFFFLPVPLHDWCNRILVKVRRTSDKKIKKLSERARERERERARERDRKLFIKMSVKSRTSAADFKMT